MVSKLEIDEDAGEILCDKCEGRGSITTNKSFEMTIICPKCQGRGKVDWVSHITGVPKPKMFGFGSSSFSSRYAAGISEAYLDDDIIDALSRNLAKKIDEEILESIMKGSNKNIKIYNQEVKTLDNGIVSKLMFHPDT